MCIGVVYSDKTPVWERLGNPHDGVFKQTAVFLFGFAQRLLHLLAVGDVTHEIQSSRSPYPVYQNGIYFYPLAVAVFVDNPKRIRERNLLTLHSPGMPVDNHLTAIRVNELSK